MIRVVGAAEMRAMDERAIRDHGVPGRDLMARAGQGMAECLLDAFSLEPDDGVMILCGKGNNGGDGFVVAARLKAEGLDPRVVLVDAEPRELKGDALWAYQEWEQAGGETALVRAEKDLDWVSDELSEAVLAVDALLGTGASGAPRGLMARVVEELGAGEALVAAVDMPTGVNADTGEAYEPAVDAHFTVTFELPKTGQVLFPGRAHCGELRVLPIGIPPQAHPQEGLRVDLMELIDFAVRLPERRPTMHKGDRGHMLAVGGSLGLTGAITLTCRAAVRAGAGKVTAGVPLSLADVMGTKLIEAMCLPLPELQSRALKRDAFDTIALFNPGQISALAVGPGLGRRSSSLDLVRRLVQEHHAPLVLDADGLYAYQGQGDSLRLRPPGAPPLVITPHLGEFRALTGVEPATALKDRFQIAHTWARRMGVVLVLKGAPTVIAHPEEDRVVVTRVGSEVLATGGTGDVLTGFIAGFLAQGLSPWDAACAGVYAHGYCADVWVQEHGTLIGMQASDLIDVFPAAMGAVYAQLGGGA